MTGTTLGHYELLERIGQGGMGEVYVARDTKLDRRVAIKIVSGVGGRDPDTLARFYREAKALAKLNHPHVVTVHEIGEENGTPFIVMEYIEGESLGRRLRSQGSLPLSTALNIAIQTCQALAFAHSQKVLHRDIKPENIMIAADGTTKVMDLGVARMTDDSFQTRPGTVMGTVAYMSPEQALGESVDERSDLYSLGVVLFEMLGGRPPFWGESAVSLVYRQVNEPPPPLSQVCPGVPQDVENLVMKTLEKGPGDRFQSAGELLTELTRCRESLLPTGRQGLESPAAPSTLVREMVPPPTCGFQPRLVGRDAELQLLQDLLHQCQKGKGRLVMIEGEAGIGKTRLVDELLGHARRWNVRVLIGRALYQEGADPYLPFTEAIRQYFREAKDEGEHKEREALKEYVQTEVPELRDVIPQIGTVIRGTSPVQSPRTDADYSRARERMFEALTNLLIQISRIRPLVFFIDDAHWASSAGLQVLHYLARSAGEEKLLILATYRLEDVEAAGDTREQKTPQPISDLIRRLSREDLCEWLELKRLSSPQVGELIDSLYPRSSFTPLLEREIFGQAEGNPLFVLEILKLMQTEGIIVRQEGVWSLRGDLREFEFPRRIYDVVKRRIDRLRPEERELLECAAVLGDDFESVLLGQVVSQDRISLLKKLQAPEKVHHIIYYGKGKYHFAHSKIREALYEGIPLELRREYHLVVGECLERVKGFDPQNSVFSLALHFGLAEHAPKAIPYGIEAGKRARLLFAYSEAREYFERVWQLLGRSSSPALGEQEMLDLRMEMGRTYDVLGRWDQAVRFFQETLEPSRRLNQLALRAESLKRIAHIERKRNSWEEALSHYRESLGISEQLQDKAGASTIHNFLGLVALERGNLAEAREQCLAALSLGEHVQDNLLLARIHNHLGIISNIMGDRKVAITHYQQCLKRYEAEGDVRGVAQTNQNLGMTLSDQGEWEGAQECYARSAEIALKVGDVRLLATTYLNWAEVSLHLLEPTKSRGYCDRALEIVKRLDDKLGIAEAHKMYGVLARLEGNWHEAERHFQEALRLDQEHESPLGQAEVLRETGLLALARGQKQAALDSLRQAETLFDKMGAKEDLAEVRDRIRELSPNGGLHAGDPKVMILGAQT